MYSIKAYDRYCLWRRLVCKLDCRWLHFKDFIFFPCSENVCSVFTLCSCSFTFRNAKCCIYHFQNLIKMIWKISWGKYCFLESFKIRVNWFLVQDLLFKLMCQKCACKKFCYFRFCFILFSLLVQVCPRVTWCASTHPGTPYFLFLLVWDPLHYKLKHPKGSEKIYVDPLGCFNL